MADTKISALTAASAAAAANELAINEAGASKKLTAAQLKTFVNTAMKVAAGTASADTQPLEFSSGTLLTTPEAGSMEYDGALFYLTPAGTERGLDESILMRALQADATGNDSATAQGWFPTNGAVAVRASTAYYFEGAISIVRTAGATSHTTGISMDGGSCTITTIGYWVQVKEGDAATIADGDSIAIQVATDTNVKAASTSTTENIVIQVWGIVWVNAAGTFKPMFKYSAAPGGAPTIEKGTYFRLRPIGGTGGITLGTWS